MKSPCSIALLESALAGNLPENAEETLHHHLEECEECSAALERMAGGPAWCQEAASLLTKDELDATVPVRDPWSEIDFTVEHLEPADDPNVLGRLGGYDVLQVIGRGGMGVVLKAFDRELKRCVAIKMLAPHLAQSALAKKRFAREAQAAAAIVHPNVLAIHQVQPSGRLPFLVMPLVAGESLAERLTTQGTLELKEILRIGIQAAAGLAAAHDQGLVHRDVKPANILLDKGVDRAFLTDFGLAHAADDVTLTRWGVVAGTPQYMSPEQVRGEPLDGRSDLFSLGCVLYEMATGVSPFRTDSLMATMRRLVDDSPQAMGSLNPELPPWFIAIVDRLLEKDPSRRFGSAKEVSELLEKCLAHVQQPASVPLPLGLPKPVRLRTWRASNRGIKGILAMITTLGIGLFGFLLLSVEPPDIAGQWSGEKWGNVVLKKTSDAEYTGTYSDAVDKQPGEIKLSWSRVERRFNGTWRVGEDRFGEISLNLARDEIRGAYTTDPKSKIESGTPRLADLIWTRIDEQPDQDESKAMAAGTVAFRRAPVQLAPSAFDVWSLAFSSDDQLLAASGGGAPNNQNPGQARIWDLAKAKEGASYSTPRGIHSMVLSPDGRRVALASWAGDLWLHEVGGAELLYERFGMKLRMAFSPDGKLLVGVTESGQLRTWDGVTGKPIENAPFGGSIFLFYWVGFSPDGKYLVATGGKRHPTDVNLAVWSVASRQQLYKKSVDVDRIYSASISSDSQTLATSGERSVPLWDLATGVRRSETESSGVVERVEFSPDGKLLASVSYESNDITLWDPSTAGLVGKLSGHEDVIRALAFTHDGKTLATGGQDQTIRLWDVATRQQTSILQGPDTAPDAAGVSGTIVAVAYSPDGNSVATAGEEGQVHVYGPNPLGLSHGWLAHADTAAALAWSPDGKTLVTAGFDKLVKFWNPATGELVRTLSGHTGWVVSLAFSHDGQTLASGSYDRSIRLWNVADGVERQTLTGHGGTIRSLAFSHNDKLLASAGGDQTVWLWDAASGVEQASLAGHLGTVRSVAFSPDDRLLASGGEDQTIKIWNVDAHDLRGTLTGHTDMVSAVAFARQTLVSTSWDRTLRTWDADALELCSKLTVGPSEVVAMTVSPDGRRMLTAGADQSLTLWTSAVVEGQRSDLLGEYLAYPRAAEFSPDGASVAVAAAGFATETELYLYDTATQKEKYKVTLPGCVRSLAFAPAGDLIALGFEKKRVLLIDAATGRELVELEAQPANVPQVSGHFGRVEFSRDGKWLVASCYDEEIRVYDVEQRKLAKTLKGERGRIFSLAVSPNGKDLVACLRGKPAIVWDLENAAKRFALPPQPGDGIFSVAYSPDGKLLATGSNNDFCCIRRADTGSVLQTFEAHRGIVFEASFSPDSKLLATAGEDGLVKLWDVATGKLVRAYDCESGRVVYVRFSPDGKSLVTACRDGQAKLLRVSPSAAN